MLRSSRPARVALVRADSPPAQILKSVNATIYENIKKLGEDKYMTITILCFNRDGTIFFSGLHQDIMIYRAKTDKVELVETKGMWIGILDDISGMLEVDQLTLEPADVMLLYTDGIPEATDRNGEMFTDEKLIKVFKGLGKKHVKEIKDGILDSLKDLQDFLQLGWLVDFPVLLRRKPDPRPVGATALVGAAERGGRGPGSRDLFRDG